MSGYSASLKRKKSQVNALAIMTFEIFSDGNRFGWLGTNGGAFAFILIK